MKNAKNSPKPVQTETVVSERPAHIDSGEDTRTNVTARENQTRTQPEPSPALAAISEGTAQKVVDLRPEKGARANLFEMRQQEISEAVSNKVHQLSEARQKLAEAADLYSEGEGKETEAQEAASKAAILLYTARTAGTISADELTGILGDQFGFKDKQDGTPSKTPKGRGEGIRKRIVRAVQGHEFVNGGDGGRFFAGLPSDEIADVLSAMEGGEYTVWRAYDLLAQIKRENANRVDIAFDPKRIASIAAKLQEDGAVAKFVQNAALRDAYTALWSVIRVVGEEAAAAIKQAA